MAADSTRQTLVQFRAHESLKGRALAVADKLGTLPNHAAHVYGPVTMSTVLRMAVYQGLAELEAELGMAAVASDTDEG